MARDEENYIPINYKDIVYINSQGNYTFVNLSDCNQYRISEKLYQLEEGILPNSFIRINKSEIVNINQITQISPMFKGNFLIHLKGYDIPCDISRNYLKEFKERLGMK